MVRRNRSWSLYLVRALTVALPAAFLTVAIAGPAQAADCSEYVTIFKSNSGGTHSGVGTATYNPGTFTMDTRDSESYWGYVTFGGVTRPRRNATFRFTNDAGVPIFFHGRGGALTDQYTTTDSADNGVIRQEWNVLPWRDLIAQAGRRLHVYADFNIRCNGLDIRVDNNYVGDVVTYPAEPVTVDPKYLVLGVIYAPPGASSSVSYGTSTTLGARLSFSQSLQTGVTQTTTVSQEQTQLISSSNSFGQKSQDSISVTVEKTTSSNIIIPGPANSQNGINHDFDRFAVWLNPRFTVTPISPTSLQTNEFTTHPDDPISPDTDVVFVSVAELRSEQFPAGTASRLQRSWSSTGALNTADFASILARNPFANGNTAIDPARFDPLGTTYDYSPAPPGGQPITQQHTIRFQEALNLSHSITHSVSFSLTGPPDSVTIFRNTLTNRETDTLEFSSTVSLDFTRTQNQTTTLSLTGPTTGYQGPTAVRAFQDKIFGTLMFAFAEVATFQIGAPSPNQTVTQGGSAAFPITTQPDFGFQGSVNFSANVMGLPAGATGSFAPTSVGVGSGSTLTVTTTASTPPGTYPLTITASSGLINRFLTVNLVVNPRPFTLTLTPTTRVVSSGQSTTYTVTVNPAPGFTGSVQLSGPGGLPPGAGASFNPSTITGGGGSSTLTVTTSASTPAGTRTLTVTATAGSFIQTGTVTLVVDNTQDFGLSVTPHATGVAAGDTATYTVTTTAINGFTGFVSLVLSGQPTGSTVWFSPNPIAGAGSSTLSLATLVSTPPGDYTLTITGTSGAITHSQAVSLSVSEPQPDFTLTASPSTRSAAPGTSTTYSVSTASVGGFTGSVGLNATGLPAGVTATFNPTTVSPGSGSTLSVSVGSAVAPGTYQLTVTGASGSLTHSQAITLTVTSPPAILGYNQIGALLDNGDMNYMNGSRYVTGPNAMTITTIAVYMKTVQPAPDNQFQVAIYTDVAGQPGTLVASSTSGTLVPNSWNTRPVSATLTANTAYWLMYNTNGDNNVSYDTGTSGDGSWSFAEQPFGTWPGTFGPAAISNLKISICAY